MVMKVFRWVNWGREPAVAAPKMLVNRIVSELKAMDDHTSTSLTVLACSIVFLAVIGYYYKRKLNKKFANIDRTVKSVDERIHAQVVVQAFLMNVLELSRRTDESMNMALYMSEMRRKAKARRPRRPAHVEDRAPELLPSLRVERCVRDGLAILDISDEDTPRAQDEVRSQADSEPSLTEAHKADAEERVGEAAETSITRLGLKDNI